MDPVFVVGTVALFGTFTLMITAIVMTDRANRYQRRATRIEETMRDVLIESLSADDIEARRIRMELLQEYDRMTAAPYIDGGF